MAIILSGTTNDILVNGVSVATDAEVSSAITDAVQTGLVALQTITTGIVSFDSATNTVSGTGVGNCEIGDVVLFSGTTDSKNNDAFTVEVINNANSIIVNQAHANKGTTKNVATRVSDSNVTVKLLAKWYNASEGLGQGWVPSSKAFNTSYSYIPNRSMSTKVTGNATNGALNYSFLVNLNSTGNIAYEQNYASGNAQFIGVDFLIPIGTDSYSFNIPGATLVSWFEQR